MIKSSAPCNLGDGRPSLEFELAEEHRAVIEAVRTPARQREVLVLRYWLGMSEAEIAQALQISPGAVKSQASRGVHKVKAYLEAMS